MLTFNLADLFETVADALPSRTALVAGDRRLTYAELDQRATRLGHHLLDAGVRPGEHVGIVSGNRAEWLEAMLGAFKARLVPINVNHRYTAAELGQVLADAECTAVVAEHALLVRLSEVAGAGSDAGASGLPRIRHAVALDDGQARPATVGGLDPVTYEDALAAASPDRDFGPRSSDDRYVLYTGGTTGAPKGVVWRAEDIFFAALGGGNPTGDPIARPEDITGNLAHEPRPWLVTSPLMHGNGQWNSLVPLLSGQGVVLWTGRRFDALAVAELAARERAFLLVLIGDGMALPFVDAVEQATATNTAAPLAEPTGGDVGKLGTVRSTGEVGNGSPLDLSSVRVVASGGAILSPVVKQRLAALLPGCAIVDGFGASETGSNGRLVGTGDGGPPRFSMRPDTTVLDDDLRPVARGSGEVGRLARRGHVPLGYWNDPAKTAATFPVGPDGTRWAIPGDLARPEADGTITLLGRGSACINTGGEKVHPEEVAAAVKSHPDIADAVVVGAPDERFGQRVVAVVTLRPGAAEPPAIQSVRDHLAPLLAGYKAPRQLVVAEALRYTPQGKPDLRWAADLAAAATSTTAEVRS